jgi:hypothetical protein
MSTVFTLSFFVHFILALFPLAMRTEGRQHARHAGAPTVEYVGDEALALMLACMHAGTF